MTDQSMLTQIKNRFEAAIAKGEHCNARGAYLELLQLCRALMLEARDTGSATDVRQARRITQNLEAIATLLDRNEQLVRIDAPFLLGEHVEIERVELGLRFVWVPGTIRDFRPAAIRARQLRNPYALDYLVREEDGEERWRADEGIRRRGD